MESAPPSLTWILPSWTAHFYAAVVIHQERSTLSGGDGRIVTKVRVRPERPPSFAGDGGHFSNRQRLRGAVDDILDFLRLKVADPDDVHYAAPMAGELIITIPVTLGS